MKRKLVVGMTVGTTVPLKALGLEGAKIEQVYTVIDPHRLYHGFNPHTGDPMEYLLEDAPLFHRHNVFIEDKGHDWNTIGENFRYNTHAEPYGSEQSLVIEYETT